MTHKQEVERRRTFAIISHPDAGKTTLTEKLLLFGGAIQVAGAVKSNKIKKTATSDFLEIEKQRGISVATSVMGFEYRDKKVNILDTPGHQDFAEDTYRTLTAVDSVIVVIDVAKGVEAQTEKLAEVCRMRNTPVIVFINKLDREGKDAFELLDEVEDKLQIKVRPMSWPIGMGQRFKGVYNLYENNLSLFSGTDKQRKEDTVDIKDLDDPLVDKMVGEDAANTLRDEVELVEGVYEPLNLQDYLDAKVAPVFFGSALNMFGVREMLDCFIDIAPSPRGMETEERHIDPLDEKFTGFVFKIHANIDPNHRNRIAFLRITSGTFERNKPYTHVRLGKPLRFSNPTSFMAQKKEVIDEAFPGDIVGLHDPGNFKIGDALSEGEPLHFLGIPSFSPEMFRYVENADPMKTKQFAKGLDMLMDEGVAQLFTRKTNNRKIIGCVGALQFEVIEHRLEHEYGAKCRYEAVSLYKACWISSDDEKELDKFIDMKMNALAEDKDGKLVFLADSAWALQMAQEQYPNIEFHFKSEF
ncbi:MAG: peptide chain release factor 3 [Flavobacteriales bacterium]|nr:peptide chain release factor 3 [Flavobacteriales bacterium]